MEEAKAALHGSALSSSSLDAKGQPTRAWLATFSAIAHAKFSKSPDTIEAARRIFRELAAAAGALVRIHAVIRRGIDASAAARVEREASKARAETESPHVDGHAFGAGAETFRSASSSAGEGRRKRRHRVRINGDEFWAATGEVLLDAALRNGIDIPHDCRSGDCGACLVRVTDGQVSCGEAGGVHACQARVTSDVVVAVDGLPEVVTTPARVVAVSDLSPDVVAVRVAPSSPLSLRPGQYLNVRFGGLPARALSPTLSLEEPGGAGLIDFHVQRIPNGRVSAALGADIRAGHRVRLTGPFGSAYLRPGGSCRLVLVAGETGFAPIWAIAAVALQEQPDRELALVVSSDMEGFYMEPALRWLAAYPNVAITCVGRASLPGFDVYPGEPAEHLPDLTPEDVVHVAGPLAMVDAVAQEAERAGAVCHAEAFRASGHGDDESAWSATILRSARRARATWLRGRWAAGPDRRAQANASPLRRSTGRIGRWAAMATVLAGVAAVLSGVLLSYMPAAPGATAVNMPASPEGSASALPDPRPAAPIQTASAEGNHDWTLRGETPEPTEPRSTNSTSHAPEHAPAGDDPHSAASVAGVWASHVSGCSPQENRRGLLPAVISPDGAWAGETTCAFRNRKESKRGWDVVATCSNPKERWTAKVRLTVDGDRLVWSSRRGTQTYQRCDARLRFANARPDPRE